jgi:hypothetical protein
MTETQSVYVSGGHFGIFLTGKKNPNVKNKGETLSELLF